MSRLLNIGCGENWKQQYPNHEGLDIVDYGQSYVLNLLDVLQDPEAEDFQCEGWWDEILANHILEHFNQDELKIVFAGINKILIDGGRFKFVVPHMEKPEAWVLSHKTFWNEFTVQWLASKDAKDVYGFGGWELEKMERNGRSDLHVILKKI